jgi:hypothetical protein
MRLSDENLRGRTVIGADGHGLRQVRPEENEPAAVH